MELEILSKTESLKKPSIRFELDKQFGQIKVCFQLGQLKSLFKIGNTYFMMAVIVSTSLLVLFLMANKKHKNKNFNQGLCVLLNKI